MFRRPVADLFCHPLFPLYHIASDCQLIKNAVGVGGSLLDLGLGTHATIKGII